MDTLTALSAALRPPRHRFIIGRVDPQSVHLKDKVRLIKNRLRSLRYSFPRLPRTLSVRAKSPARLLTIHNLYFNSLVENLRAHLKSGKL